jgi:proteic killer suppression protein
LANSGFSDLEYYKPHMPFVFETRDSISAPCCTPLLDFFIAKRNTDFVIRSFAHKGLEKFFRTGSKVRIQAQHAVRLRLQLTMLDDAGTPEDLDAPGWRLHPLHGDLKSHRPVTVSGNWRLTFRFEGEDAILVDYQDYH